jgi:hypothetical protein
MRTVSRTHDRHTGPLRADKTVSNAPSAPVGAGFRTVCLVFESHSAVALFLNYGTRWAATAQAAGLVTAGVVQTIPLSLSDAV